MRFGAGNYPRNIFLWGGCHPKQRNRSQLVPAPHQVSQGLHLCTRAWRRGLERLHPGLRLPMRKTSGGTTPHSSSGPIVSVPTGGCLYICTVCPQTCPLCARTGRSRSQGLQERESFSLVLWREGSCESFRLTILASTNLLKSKKCFLSHSIQFL